ncbi:hypothetical protein DENIS_2311 [Desulfonema ishimotonii]|uniref:Uncharacterized protein n=1 Tax=Desulfonema ishimotonii TaxID=45657 RepID=A0A401FWL8_9BACT|nr:hypothetical protein [Desulfonema ishimotonii]GBC61351.1 hypothetical protein DENIS_2311 [Desulfonema ishimotonii]
MPAPAKAQILPFVQAAAANVGFTGEQMGDMNDVIADTVAQALSLFAAQAKVLPGIPAVVAPPPAAPTGSTVGPGMFMPPPAGGPDKSVIKPIVEGLFAAKGFTGENISDLADVIAEGIAQGILLFTTSVKVAPGIPIAGAVTSAPGKLI